MELVEHQRPVLAARVEGHRLEAELVRHHVDRPAELAFVQVEAEDAVEARGSEEQAAFPHRDLVAMLEIGVAPGADRLEIGGIREELVTGRDVDGLAVEGDAAQAAVPARPCQSMSPYSSRRSA